MKRISNNAREPGSLHRLVRRRTHAQAVSDELKRWSFDYGEEALVLAFCACVFLKMKGGDMDDLLKPPNDKVSDPATPL